MACSDSMEHLVRSMEHLWRVQIHGTKICVFAKVIGDHLPIVRSEDGCANPQDQALWERRLSEFLDGD